METRDREMYESIIEIREKVARIDEHMLHLSCGDHESRMRMLERRSLIALGAILVVQFLLGVVVAFYANSVDAKGGSDGE